MNESRVEKAIRMPPGSHIRLKSVAFRGSATMWTEKGSILSNIDIDVYLILGRVKYDRFNVPRFDKSKRAGRNLFDEFIHGKTSAQKYTSNPAFPLNWK